MRDANFAQNIVIPAKASIQRLCSAAAIQEQTQRHWMPAFAGMTEK